MTISQGMSQITVIIDNRFEEQTRLAFGNNIVCHIKDVSALGIRFDEAFSMNGPGFLYTILQHVSLQGINLIEIASTYTEFILYLDSKDVRVAFDSLYSAFLARKGQVQYA